MIDCVMLLVSSICGLPLRSSISRVQNELGNSFAKPTMASRSVFLLLVTFLCMSMIHAYKEELKKTIASCQNGKEVTDDEIEEFVKPLIPQTEEEKCLVACVFKQFNVINGGSFDPRIALAVAKDLLKSEPEKVQKITSVINHCGDDIPKKMDNECDLAHEIMQCYVKWEKEVGMI